MSLAKGRPVSTVDLMQIFTNGRLGHARNRQNEDQATAPDVDCDLPYFLEEATPWPDNIDQKELKEAYLAAIPQLGI